MKKYKLSIITLALLSVLLLVPHHAQADMAPPANPPGTNPVPGVEITQVRMVAETVLIEILAQAPKDSLGRARVTAEFTMRNLGSEAESMAARFPVGASDGYSVIEEIADFGVSVDGKPTATRQIEGEDPRYGDMFTVPWQEFDVSFPPNEDVMVTVTYTLEASGYYPFAYYEYFLTTGGAWKGTIGSAEIIARFPYEVSSMNVIHEPSTTGLTQMTRDAVLSGNEVRWYFEDFEPTGEENIRLLMVSTEAWDQVLKEREIVANNPKDGEAWGRLGKLYKEIAAGRRELRDDSGGLQLYDLSVQAYENCLELLPEDALWHVGFAELLWLHGIWGPGGDDDLQRAAEEINLALELDPQNERLHQILDEAFCCANPDIVVKNADGSYAVVWLTATPTKRKVSTPTEAAPTSTPEPPATLQDTPTKHSDPSEGVTPDAASPMCGSVAVLSLAMLAFTLTLRRGSH